MPSSTVAAVRDACRWERTGRVTPRLRPFVERVPVDGDREFWLGEVLTDLRQAATSRNRRAVDRAVDACIRESDRRRALSYTAWSRRSGAGSWRR